jgi:hypothetical protein
VETQTDDLIETTSPLQDPVSPITPKKILTKTIVEEDYFRLTVLSLKMLHHEESPGIVEEASTKVLF